VASAQASIASCDDVGLQYLKLSGSHRHVDRWTKDREGVRIEPTRMGWVYSPFVSGYAGFMIPGGELTDRLGPRGGQF
jgi:hypothetical protein